MKIDSDMDYHQMVWRTSLMKEMTDEDLERTGRLLKELIDGRNTAVLVNGYTAWKLTFGDEKYPGILLPYLKKALGKRFTPRFLEHVDKDVVDGREVRRIITKPEKISVSGATDLLFIVYSNESGFTYNGTVYYGLKNFDVFEKAGAKRAWFLTGLDYQRIAQIPIYRGSGNYRGTIYSLMKHAENAFWELVNADRFRYMANVIPENDLIQQVSEMNPKQAKNLQHRLYKESDLLREAGLLYKATRGRMGTPPSPMKRLQDVISG